MRTAASALALLLVSVFLAACSEPTPETPAENATSTQAPPATPGGNSSVQIQTGGAGGAAPVTGTENLQGGGGYGVGQAAKDQARAAAGSAGSGSLSPELETE